MTTTQNIDIDREVDASLVRRPWKNIHADHKTTIDGIRKVLVWVDGVGSCLVNWAGPK